MSQERGFSSRAIHGGNTDIKDAHNALAPPIYLSSTYTFESLDEANAAFSGDLQRMVYGRVHSPTQELLEKRLATLERGEASVALGSGMAAISALIWTLLKSGDELLAHNKMYGNTYTLFTKELSRFGISVKLLDFNDLDAVESAFSCNTKVLFYEVPSNPLLEVIDVEAVSKLARENDIISVVDSTLASPFVLQPLTLGADLVVHSLTKYISGHGDMIGGAVIGAEEYIKNIRMRGLRYFTGATLSGLSCYLALRGLKTLSLRMQRHCSNAAAIALYLQEHHAVNNVYYPGLKSHPQHRLVEKIMHLPGGMLSLELTGGLEHAKIFINRLQLCKHAVSLGDAETLVQHPASMTHSHYQTEELNRYGITPGLVRLSAGLEDEKDILFDIAQALDC